jgi:hypothetical protein
MRFSKRDDEEDTRKTQRGIEMPKYPHRAPKGSKTQAASFISEDDDTSAISGTTDDEENLRSTKQTKKQHPVTLRKASEDASNPAWSDDEDKEPKKASKKSGTARIGLILPATIQKASKDATSSDHDEVREATGKKKGAEPAQSSNEDKELQALKKSATVRKCIPDSNQPSQKTSKRSSPANVKDRQICLQAKKTKVWRRRSQPAPSVKRALKIKIMSGDT